MTKLRAPLSTDAAIVRIAGQLPGGFEELGRVLGMSAGHLRNCSDPDKREEISFPKAIEADLAYRAAGGQGSPLFETFAHQLDEAGALRFAGQHALARHVEVVAREAGEAVASLIAASRPDACNRTFENARHEGREALASLQKALLLLDPAAFTHSAASAPAVPLPAATEAEDASAQPP